MISSQRPLSGKRIVITRARNQAAEFVARIQEMGGEAIVCPVLKIVPPQNQAVFDDCLFNLASYDWMIFTSTNGVRFFFRRAQELGINVLKSMGNAQVAAVGSKTAAALSRQGIHVEQMASQFTAEGLLETLKDQVKQEEHVLLSRGNLARDLLPQELRKLGLHVTDVVAYDTVAAEENIQEVKALLKQKKIDMITFASSSAVRFFLAALGEEDWRTLLKNVVIAVIGPITANTVKGLGLHVDVMAEEYTISGLIEAIVKQAQSSRA